MPKCVKAPRPPTCLSDSSLKSRRAICTCTTQSAAAMPLESSAHERVGDPPSTGIADNRDVAWMSEDLRRCFALLGQGSMSFKFAVKNSERADSTGRTED